MLWARDHTKYLQYRHLTDIRAFCKGMTPRTVYSGKYFSLGQYKQEEAGEHWHNKELKFPSLLNIFRMAA
jgi:hypothetical protein